ncbi:MAG: hypothetical protein HYU66_11015 [Armatimonadetes bacterium]|nr:hypothetical protein [Armatimonadota bacterium]
MSAAAPAWAAVVGVLAAAAVSLTDAMQSPAGAVSFAAWNWARKTLLRAVSLTAFVYFTQHLTARLADAVWHDLDVFLLRATDEPATAAWLPLWLGFSAGLVGCVVTLPPRIAASLAWFVAFAAVCQTAAVVRLLPLPHGDGARLMGIGAVTCLPAVLLALASELRAAADRTADDAPLGELRGIFAGSAVLLLLAAPVCLSQRWLEWQAPRLLVLLPAGGLSIYWVLSSAPHGQTEGWRAAVRSWAQALGERKRNAWIVFTALACLWHSCVVFTVTTRVAAESWQVLARVAAWPQLLAGEPEPGADRWRAAAGRLDILIARYDGHPWCGQWLLMRAWIEDQQLGGRYRARVMLLVAAKAYPHARAAPPPYWAAGATVGEVAHAMLERWGVLVDPGSQPA